MGTRETIKTAPIAGTYRRYRVLQPGELDMEHKIYKPQVSEIRDMVFEGQYIVEIDWEAVQKLAERAVRAKTGKSRSLSAGPIKVTARIKETEVIVGTCSLEIT